jgi:hypothetical protein
MSRWSGIIDRDLRVDEDATVSGIVKGTLTIGAGARVTVSGIVNGALVVEPDAVATITGIVNGAIDDRGGRVEVTGIAAR